MTHGKEDECNPEGVVELGAERCLLDRLINSSDAAAEFATLLKNVSQKTEAGKSWEEEERVFKFLACVGKFFRVQNATR